MRPSRLNLTAVTDEPDHLLTADLQALAEAARYFVPDKDNNPGPTERYNKAFRQWSLDAYPSHFDYVESGILSAVRNQGTWFACTSFAIAAVIESRHRKKYGRDVRIVPGHLHNCLAQRDNSLMGLDMKVAADLCRDLGVLIGANDAMPVSPSVCASTGNRFRISSHGYIAGPEAAIAKFLAHGPLLVDIHATADFFLHRGDGVFDCPELPAQSILHSLVMVGYDFREAEKFVLVQHSGGSSWGMNGFGKVRMGAGGLLGESVGGRQAIEIIV